MNLVGKLLVAMPGMGDPRFDHSVILMCVHSDEGAMGLIVNKPAPELTFADLIEQLGITRKIISSDIRVDFVAQEMPPVIRIHFGGPVEPSRGFVLHSSDYDGHGSTLRVGEDFAMTATLDILQDMADGEGPAQSLLALGYAGWGPGQLEAEIRANGWLTCETPSGLVFADDDATKWNRALRSMGVDPLSLSAAAGNA